MAFLLNYKFTCLRPKSLLQVAIRKSQIRSINNKASISKEKKKQNKIAVAKMLQCCRLDKFRSQTIRPKFWIEFMCFWPTNFINIKLKKTTPSTDRIERTSEMIFRKVCPHWIFYLHSVDYGQ